MAVKYFTKPFFLSTLICVFLFFTGIVPIPEKNNFQSLLHQEGISSIYGTILSTPSKISSGKYYSAFFQVKQVYTASASSTATGNTTIFIPSEIIEAYFPGKLFSSAIKKGAFLYEAGAEYNFCGKFHEGVFYVTKCQSCLWPEGLSGKIDYFRALCRLHFKRLMYAWGEAGGLLLALLSGAREYTNSETSEAFRNAGLSHILALSGMHLSMFSSIAVFLGNKIGRKKITYCFRIFVLVLFVWFAGFSPSLLRAFICSFLTLFAAMGGTENPDNLMILCFSFLIQCTISPTDINNIGFILSYSALAGILLFSRTFHSIYTKFLPGFLANSLGASTAAQIFTAPVSIKVFGSFSPIGIIATTVVSPFVTIFIYSGLCMIILGLIIPALQAPSGIFINLQYTVIKYLTVMFSHAPKWSLN